MPLIPAKKKQPESNPVPLRALFNPPHRLEIRPDFPKTLDSKNAKKSLAVIEEQLQKFGTTLDKVKRINLAYPHKHPELYYRPNNKAEAPVKKFRDILQKEAPHIQWIIADGICDTIDLGRSEDQSSVHAVMNRQAYKIHVPSQKETLPFISRENTEKEFFIVVDWNIEQGTTIANLMSYITHNGGIVLAAVAESTPEISVAQQKRPYSRQNVTLSAKFNDAARNTARLPELAAALSASAKKMDVEWSPNKCLRMFEARLQKCGTSVFALTNGECDRLIETVSARRIDGHRFFDRTVDLFPSLIKKFDVNVTPVAKPPKPLKKSLVQRLLKLKDR